MNDIYERKKGMLAIFLHSSLLLLHLQRQIIEHTGAFCKEDL